jgi:hypothetical protein
MYQSKGSQQDSMLTQSLQLAAMQMKLSARMHKNLPLQARLLQAFEAANCRANKHGFGTVETAAAAALSAGLMTIQHAYAATKALIIR